jgi:hypothetical protein
MLRSLVAFTTITVAPVLLAFVMVPKEVQSPVILAARRSAGAAGAVPGVAAYATNPHADVPKSPISPDRLREMLADDERRLAALDGSIERQQRFVERLEVERYGDSTTADMARALLATMKRARMGYIADRERMTRLLHAS